MISTKTFVHHKWPEMIPRYLASDSDQAYLIHEVRSMDRWLNKASYQPTYEYSPVLWCADQPMWSTNELLLTDDPSEYPTNRGRSSHQYRLCSKCKTKAQRARRKEQDAKRSC